MTQMENLEVERKQEVFSADLKSIQVDDKGRMTFWAKSLHDGYLPEQWLKATAEDSIGARFLYRHRSPDDPKHADEPIYGKVLQSKVEMEKDKFFVLSQYMIKTHHRRGRQLAEIIERRAKEGNPFGVSMKFDVWRSKETKEIVAVDVHEHSATWKPACKLCVVLEDNGEDDIMPNEQNTKDQGKPKSTEDLIAELDGKRVSLEADLVKKSQELEDYKKTTAENTKITQSLVEKLTQRLETIEKYNVYLEKVKPLVDELMKFEDDKDEEFKKDLKAMYDLWPLEKLMKRLEKKRAEPPVGNRNAEVADVTAKRKALEADAMKNDDLIAELRSRLKATDAELKAIGVL